MKEYEKLAGDFSTTETYCDSSYTAKNAYIAGFLKAKEMTLENFKLFSDANPIVVEIICEMIRRTGEKEKNE